MIIPKKSKFQFFEWQVLRKYLEGNIGELHHFCGKSYEKLAYLRPMSVEDHRSSGHKKYIHGIPKEVAEENVAYWKQLLKEDYEWFVAEGLVCD